MKDIKKIARELARVSPHSTQNYISWAHSLAYEGYSPEEVASIMEKRLECLTGTTKKPVANTIEKERQHGVNRNSM